MKKKILIILAVIACIIVALVGYSAYEVHQSAQEFQKTYESKKSFERTETNEAEADGEKKAEEQSGDRPYGVLEPGGEYEVDTYIDNRDNSNRLYIYDMDYVDLALDYDDSRENPQSVYYPIYDYISKMYLDKYVTILNYMDKKFTAEKNSAGKITIENSLLMKHIGKLKTDEFKKSGLTIFDLALLLKVSTPAAEFDKKVGKDIMRESLQMIYEYMSTIVLGDDLDWIYGNFVFDQVKAFDKNVDWYFANWRDDFSDYVDDLMQIAANELENKEQENLCEKMQELIENARERRE